LDPRQFYREYLGKSGLQGDLREVPPQDWFSPEMKPFSRWVQINDTAETQNRATTPEIAANVAVIQDGKILLVEREDFLVWCIPGGMVDTGETLAEAARRELREETGLEVVLDRLVGVYSEPERFQRGLHVVLFAGHIRSGELHPQPEEILQAGFFRREELPQDFLYGHRQRILDAMDGVGGGAAWTQATPWPFRTGLSRADIYNLRDRSGLSRAAFYRLHFRLPKVSEEIDELSML
jgi:ADP-ribose pyrophosphatase YjhB (NUDIX family)